MDQVYGYVRVSTKEQNEARQIAAMREVGVAPGDIYMDKQSGADFEREMCIRDRVCAISLDDGVVFEIGTISPIREDDIYGGYRVMLNARFDTLPVSYTHLTVSLSTRRYHPHRNALSD